MSSSEQKSKLQPVHRIFLGELFVFIFFFAGAMSVLVGPMGRPLMYSALLVSAGVVISGLTFFWFVYTTPSRTEPRYGFMVLSLLPTIAMSPVIVLVTHYVSVQVDPHAIAAARPRDQRMFMLVIVELLKHGTSSIEAPEHRLQAAQRHYAREIKALEVELARLGFSDNGMLKTKETNAMTKRFERTIKGEYDVAVETRLSFEDDAKFKYSAVITNWNMDASKVYFDQGDDWAWNLQLRLMEWCEQYLKKPAAGDE